MNILFVCKHNRFRSKVAEAIFNKLNKNKSIKARSRGMIRDIDAANSVVDVLRKRGYVLKNKKSVKLTKKDVLWSNVIVNVADNVILPDYAKKKKILRWRISDTDQLDVIGIKKRIEMIERKVRSLLISLENTEN